MPLLTYHCYDAFYFSIYNTSTKCVFIVYIISIHIYFLFFDIFFSISTSPSKKNFLSSRIFCISLTVDMLMMNFLSFHMSEAVFILLSFLKTVLLGIEFQFDIPSFLSTLKISFHYRLGFFFLLLLKSAVISPSNIIRLLKYFLFLFRF